MFDVTEVVFVGGSSTGWQVGIGAAVGLARWRAVEKQVVVKLRGGRWSGEFMVNLGGTVLFIGGQLDLFSHRGHADSGVLGWGTMFRLGSCSVGV